MKKILALLTLYNLFGLFAWAQNPVQMVLNEIAQNNIHLKAIHQRVLAEQADLATLNNLEDPEIEYIYQWASPSNIGHQTEMNATQSFEFPTVYAQRAKYKKIQERILSLQEKEELQEIKLSAISLCMELIGLNRSHELLTSVVNNLKSLKEQYEVKVQEGNAIVLELNKIRMDLMENEASCLQVENERQLALRQLALLNGGNEIQFPYTDYPNLPASFNTNDLLDEFHQANASLLRLNEEVNSSGQQVKIAKQHSLPDLTFGYRRNTAQGEHYDGIIAGISIPLFSNHKKVKLAKAQQLAKQLELQEQQQNLDFELLMLYDRYMNLKSVSESYDLQLVEEQQQSIKKALDFGKFSTIDYLIEYKSTLENLLKKEEVDQSLHQTLAQLLQYRY